MTEYNRTLSTSKLWPIKINIKVILVENSVYQKRLLFKKKVFQQNPLSKVYTLLLLRASLIAKIFVKTQYSTRSFLKQRTKTAKLLHCKLQSCIIAIIIYYTKFMYRSWLKYWQIIDLILLCNNKTNNESADDIFKKKHKTLFVMVQSYPLNFLRFVNHMISSLLTLPHLLIIT